MAGARLVLGGELDIASGDEVNKAKDEILGVFREHQSKKNLDVIWRNAAGAGTVAGAAATVIELQPESPAVGKLWNITQIIAVGLDGTTALTGKVTWYLSDPANANVTQIFFPNMSVPGQQSFSSKVIIQHPQERLFGVVTGGTAGENYTLIARLGEYDDDSLTQRKI